MRASLGTYVQSKHSLSPPNKIQQSFTQTEVLSFSPLEETPAYQSDCAHLWETDMLSIWADVQHP